jgi:hypothetical protein
MLASQLTTDLRRTSPVSIATQKFAPGAEWVYSSGMLTTPLVRCGGCGEAPLPGRTLRRGRCQRCYDDWVKSRPLGLGALCASCGDRRRVHLRYYELPVATHAPGGRWLVLCHNCVGAAEKLEPPPRSVEALKMRLQRERRWGDRRAESVGRAQPFDEALDRRQGDRRQSPRNFEEEAELEATIDDELVIELEADYEVLSEGDLVDIEEVTGIHLRIAE